MVRMTDGIRLATDYYLPRTMSPPFPTVMARSTYGRGMEGEARAYNARSYAYVVQDVRGFGDSEGEGNVFYADGWREGLADGADTVAWIQEQPWSNGTIGTTGGSALGITQVLLAPSTDVVKGQLIVVASSNLYGDISYQGGVWRKNLCEGWLKMIQREHLVALWKAHPYYDEFWAYFNAEAQAPNITAPGIHVGAWYDIFQQGTINNFTTRQHEGGEGARGNQYLVIKPNGHGNYAEGACLALPENACALPGGDYYNKLMDHWLQGTDLAPGEIAPVHYYVLGDDTDPGAPGMEWRTADDWPPFPTTATAFHLFEDGVLRSAEASTEASSACFVYDPANPFPTHGGQNLLLPLGPFDQREVNEGRTDLLKFTTDPLTEPMEITGRVTVRLFVSTDAPDTDFTAKLVDVFPPGDDREVLMLDNIQRVKLRDSFEAPAPLLMSPDTVVELEIDLWSISWIFNTGHRVGLQISSSNYPRFEKNPNTGDDFPDEANLRTANNCVHMGGAYPSVLILPVPSED